MDKQQDIAGISVQDKARETLRRSSEAKKVRPWVKYSLIVLVWLIFCGAAAGGIFWKISYDRQLMQAQVTTAIENMQQNNLLVISDMQQKIDTMSTEIAAISASMSQTGSAISSTGTATRKAMEQKIKELDNQLAALQKSLKIIQEKSGR